MLFVRNNAFAKQPRTITEKRSVAIDKVRETRCHPVQKYSDALVGCTAAVPASQGLRRNHAKNEKLGL